MDMCTWISEVPLTAYRMQMNGVIVRANHISKCAFMCVGIAWVTAVTDILHILSVGTIL